MLKRKDTVFITILKNNFQLPPFIVNNKWAKANYKRWLQKRAYTHVLRDRYRFPKQRNKAITLPKYLLRIHKAVIESKGNDHYTNDPLDWGLIVKQTAETSVKMKWKLKEKFGMLPTVDHENPDNYKSPFRICSWATNNCKNDLDIEELLKFCNKVIKNMNK